MRLPTLAASASLLLLALPLAACSGGSPTSAQPGGTAAGSAAGGSGTDAAAGSTAPVNVCSLMSAAQASAITGVKYASSKPGYNACLYTPASAPNGLTILVRPGAGTAAWHAELGLLQADGGTPAKPLTGAGDRAAGSGTEIGVQSGGHIIVVFDGDANSGGGFTHSIALAKAIIPKLH
ncbi:MAG TPA: hypothetical protein VH637_24760 [Streptosporangiaceae bacterium]|jgi:hypothetical protein